LKQALERSVDAYESSVKRGAAAEASRRVECWQRCRNRGIAYPEIQPSAKSRCSSARTSVDIFYRPLADKGEGATRGPGKPGEQHPQCFVRNNILGAGLNPKKRAIDIEEIGGAGERRYPCENARLHGGGTLPNPGVGEGRPRLALRQGRALLQKLD
jgi:hypothetical protein